MSQGLFYVSTVNPNDATGGGGCICSPEKQTDCKPPYIVVPGNDLENIASPHVVVCQRCAGEMASKLAGEPYAAGESEPGIAAHDRHADALQDLARGDLDDEVPEV